MTHYKNWSVTALETEREHVLDKIEHMQRREHKLYAAIVAKQTQRRCKKYIGCRREHNHRGRHAL